MLTLELEGCPVTLQTAGDGSSLVYIISSKPMEEVQQRLASGGISSAAVQCRGWYGDLSPWPAPQVYNDAEPFTGGAGEFLAALERIIPEVEARLPGPVLRRCIAGYSMAGLFALWAGYNSSSFSHVCSASGAVWFEGWLEYMEANRPADPRARFYLSVGSRERKTRNVRMAKVVENTRLSADILAAQGHETVFELNEGGHFNDPGGRLAKGIERVFGLQP